MYYRIFRVKKCIYRPLPLELLKHTNQNDTILCKSVLQQKIERFRLERRNGNKINLNRLKITPLRSLCFLKKLFKKNFFSIFQQLLSFLRSRIQIEPSLLAFVLTTTESPSSGQLSDVWSGLMVCAWPCQKCG